MTISDELRAQVEKAFDYRGHVTIALKDGKTVEGFIFSRDFEHGNLDIMVKNSDERRRVELASIAGVTLSGEDCAAGKSYEDLKKAKGPAAP
jgi:hypothetical protein